MSDYSGCFVIAEAGVNHNGSLDVALELVSAAKDSGADAVKFQTFSADRLVTRSASKAEYQKAAVPGDDTQYSMLKALELGADDFRAIQSRCNEAGIEFLSSPFDQEAADLLNSIGIRLFKVPSGEVTNIPLLRHIGRMKKDVILSTGMCNLDDVEVAVNTLRDAGAATITLLHCVTEYPAPFEQINLRAMHTLREAFGLPVGYSDHTAGFEISIAAVALGATVIEKHFTLDTKMRGPDHSASLNPVDFAAMVSSIRKVEQSMGDGIKRPAACEIPNMDVARKSIVAARQLVLGTVLTEVDLAVKRPGSGIPPTAWDAILGKRVLKALEIDEPLRWQDLQ